MPRELPRRITKHFDADLLISDLQRWTGTTEVGEEIAKAKQHSAELYKGFYKRPADDLHKIIMEIFETGSDPKAAPIDSRVRSAWAQLPEAIEAASDAYQQIMLVCSPYDAKATKLFLHSVQAFYSLVEAERLLDGYL